MEELTFDEFQLLDELTKTWYVENNGVYLEVSRFQDECKIALFSVGPFYVEVWYHIEREKLIRLKAFKDYKKLDEYIDNIDIKPLT